MTTQAAPAAPSVLRRSDALLAGAERKGAQSPLALQLEHALIGLAREQH